MVRSRVLVVGVLLLGLLGGRAARPATAGDGPSHPCHLGPVFLTPLDDPPAADPPGTADVEDLRQRLFKGESDPARALAADRLLHAGKEGVAALNEALASPEDRIVNAVLSALSLNRDERFITPLLALLASDREKLVPAVIDALAAIDNVIPALVAAVERAETSAPARVRMITVLGKTRSRLAVEPLIQYLDHPDEAVRAETVRALQRITRMRLTSEEEWTAWWVKNKSRPRERWLDEAFEALSQSFEALEAEIARRDAKVRELKTKLLQLRLEQARKETNGRGETAVLLGFLEDPEYRDVRRGVLEEVTKLGRERAKEAVPILLKGLLDADPDAVVAYAAALGTIGDERAVAGLIGALANESPSVRKEAALALGKVGGPEAGTALVAALGDSERVVLLAILEAIKLVKPRAALGPLRDLMKRSAGQDAVQRAVVEALGELGDPAATPDVIAFLQQAKGAKDRLSRWSAANSLGKIGDAAALVPLTELLADEFTDVRQAAVEALGRLKDPGAAAPLRSALRNDKDPYVRELAARGLALAGSPDSIDPLIESLGDAEPKVAAAAWEAIKALDKGDPARIESVAARLISAGRTPQAIETLTALVADAAFGAPAFAERRLAAQRKLAELLVEARQWKEAYPLLNEVEKSYPDDPQLKERLAACARELGEYDRAQDLFANLLGREEKGSDRWYARRLALLELRLKKKEYDAALHEVKELLPTAPPGSQLALQAVADQAKDAIRKEQDRINSVRTRLDEILAVYSQAEPARQKGYEKEVHDFGKDAAVILLDALRPDRKGHWAAASALLGSLTGIVAPLAPDATPEQLGKAVKQWQEWLSKPR